MTLKQLTEQLKNNRFDDSDLLSASISMPEGEARDFVTALSDWFSKANDPVVVIENNPAVVATTLEDEDYMKEVVDALSPEAREGLKNYLGE